MIDERPIVETRPPDLPAPMIRVIKVKIQGLRFTVQTQGTVYPRTESALVSEIAGRVVEVSPSLAAGGFFEKGATLLKVDPTDYQLAAVQAQAQIVQARLALQTEQTQSAVAIMEWKSLGKGEASPLLRRVPQLAQAQANLTAAQASLEQANRNLEKTKIIAPFAGRVRQKEVDIGQFVTQGVPLGTIYAVDFAEVRLPLPDRDLAYLDLPLSYRGDRTSDNQPLVLLRTEFGQRKYSWSGRIVRTEGAIDPQTRMIHAIAQISDPYGRGPDPNRPPLAVGMFVEAEIQGRWIDNVVILPRASLRRENQVLIVDPESRLRFREVKIVRLERERVIINSGLQEGELVSLATLDTVIDGMKVRIENDVTRESSQ